MKKRARRKFTAEYKAEVVRLIRDGGKMNLPRFGGHLG